MKIKEGQVWLLGNGERVTIEKNPEGTNFIWRGVKDSGKFNTYTRDGKYFLNSRQSVLDLFEPIEDIPQTNNQENLYSEQDIRDAWSSGVKTFDTTDRENLIQELQKRKDSEYKEYLRLKEKFE